MESDLQQHHKPQQNMNSSSSLLRYRSAPSSYFANVLDTEFNEPFFNRAASPETESILARFMSSQGGDVGVTEEVVPHQEVEITQQPQFLVPKLDNDTSMIQQQQQQHEQHEQHQHKQQQQSRMNNYTSQGFYQIPSAKPPLPNQNLASSKEGALAYPMGSNQFPPMKTGGLTHSNLIRTSSSPAGLFANINIDVAGYAALRGMGNVGVNNSTNEEASFSPSSRLKNVSSGLPISPSSRMSPIPEVRKRRNRSNNQEHVGGGFNEGRCNSYVSGFNMGSWEDSSLLPDEIIGSTDFIDEDEDVKRITGLNASESQNMVAGNRPLAHHLSLPRTSAEMATIESFMQYQDSVPCKIRAKRGCATHPRSIAERVRRTRISERMRKLQELVPNMDKQTNTADMLDLAVDYIKDLQTEVQTLSGARSKCTCSSQQNQ